MINHLRTLLLNQDGTPAVDPTTPGEEYVSPRFRAVPLARPLLPLRALLFGTNPDRLFLNARLRQYLTVLHVCGMDQAEDSRLSYPGSGGETLYDAVAAGPTSQQTAGSAGAWIQLVLSNFARAENRLDRRWRLSVTSGSDAYLEWTPDDGQVHRETLPYATSGGTGSLLLPDMPVTVFFAPETGNAWTIRLVARPRVDLATIVQEAPRLACNGPARSLLFDPEPDLARIADNHPVLLNRLAAVLRALALWVDRNRGASA